MISVDAEKAFDSVNWNFLYRILHRFGLHDTIIETIQALYNKPTARIKVIHQIALPWKGVQDRGVHGHQYYLRYIWNH